MLRSQGLTPLAEAHRTSGSLLATLVKGPVSAPIPPATMVGFDGGSAPVVQGASDGPCFLHGGFHHRRIGSRSQRDFFGTWRGEDAVREPYGGGKSAGKALRALRRATITFPHPLA
jgi:hypothetical protein